MKIKLKRLEDLNPEMSINVKSLNKYGNIIEVEEVEGYDGLYRDEDDIFEEDEIEEVIKEKGMWKPKKDEIYCYITDFGTQNVSENDELVADKERIITGNTFKDERTARIQADREKFIRLQYKWVLKNDPENAGDLDIQKGGYFICLNIYGKNKKWNVKWTKSYVFPGAIFFSTRKKAEECLEWLKKYDNLSKVEFI